MQTACPSPRSLQTFPYHVRGGREERTPEGEGGASLGRSRSLLAEDKGKTKGHEGSLWSVSLHLIHIWSVSLHLVLAWGTTH